MRPLHSIWQQAFLLLTVAGWLCSSATGRAAILLSENFDGVIAPAIPAGWTATAISTNNFPAWKTAANFADTFPNAVFAPDQTNICDNLLTSPPVLIAGTNAQVSFTHKFDLESDPFRGYDGGVLEISVNGGLFIDIEDAGGVFLANGYVRVLDNSFGNPLDNRMAWTGNSGGFVTTVAKLPASVLNNQVQLRWRCGTDNSVGLTGWYVDSISLTDSSGSAVGPTITNISRNGSNITFTFATVAGQSYTIEYKNSMDEPNWTFFQSVSGDGTIKLISDSLGSPQRFYRVKSP